MPAKHSFSQTQRLLLGLQFGGDVIVSLLALCAGYWIRFHSPLHQVGIEARNPEFGTYAPLLIFGATLLLSTYGYLKLYDPRLLLRPHRAISIILRGTFFWFLLFLGASLILKSDPPISRLFAATSCVTTLVFIIGWRYAYYSIVSRSRWRDRMTQRVLLVGWNTEALKLADAISYDKNHPYIVHGILTTPSTTQAITGQRHLGDWKQLESTVAQHHVDIVVVADLDLTRNEMMEIASLCERRYIEFKVIPSFFQIFVSNLRMQTISGVPLLGIEQIPLNSLLNRAIKRSVDIVGALVGLFFSVPLMAILAVLIRREGPGPVFFRQIRTGRNGENFPIYKMRSMKVDAESGTGPAWAVKDDPRRLKIGATMREWNLDEIPQFWNVLTGDMSLVGPRPERPELIVKFQHEIPHYNPRHEVRPGITGWAQVNGLRGNTSLVDRIQYDLYYIENWSLWFDFQIMLLTFFRRKNAY